jgi:hypothetical protein
VNQVIKLESPYRKEIKMNYEAHSSINLMLKYEKKGIIPMNSTLSGGELNDEIEKKSIKKEQKKTRVNPV